MDHHDTDTTSSRRRRASAPVLIALVLGLILATSGGAVAGKQITGKQIKNNSVTGKDIKNKSLGLHDLKLLDVDKLADGILPSGKTVIGGGILSGNAPSDTLYARSYSPLPFKTTVPLSYNNPRSIYYGQTSIAAPGESNTSRCSGSDTNPTASPGTLCVYISGSTTNAGNQSFIFPGANASPDAADSTGFYLGVNTPTTGEVLVRYTWAYTAP
ncbi:hypothetical protein [Nocardioides sp.]|uniref:hypothetical protein n=1 Tax=Nocardioides sp. TaxID=35761 RepID=UPI002B272428|nr:hypothetical protein [Nocardioides sp.]